MAEETKLLHREIYEKAKRYEERVAELFRLHGYQTVVDYKRNDQQFDIRLEKRGVPPVYALVECKDTTDRVGQQDILKFKLYVDHASKVDRVPYQPIMIARSGFVNHVKAVADTEFIHFMTFRDLLLSLVDLEPNLEAAIRSFEEPQQSQQIPLKDLYVEQDAVLEKAITSGEHPHPKGLTRTVLEWLEHPTATFLALLGDFGCGKSSFCKRLAWELARKSKEKPGEVRMPILVDLREGRSTTVTLENLLTHHFQRLSNQAFNPQALLHLNSEGYLLLIFDGFDETIAYSEPARYLDNLRQILRAAEGKAKVLLTCRTHYFRDRPEVLKGFGQSSEMISSPGATKLYEEIQGRAGAEIGYVLEFREPQIEEYLQRALPPSEDRETFRQQIRDTYDLEELAKRPFLLEIIVKTLPHLLARGAEITLADLYSTYCEKWFTHTDPHLTLTREHKVTLVEHLACLIWSSPENRVHYRDLADKAAEFFQDRPLSVIEKERIDYEVRTALFLHRDPEGYYSFIHRSFLEFFIARALRAGLASGDPECLALKRLTREVAFFLEFWPESKRIPDLARKVLEAERRAGISENALFLLYFHARATQGPLVGPEAEQVDLQEIRKVFSRLRPRRLQLAGADLEAAVLPGIDLSGALLQKAKLTRADLRHASLAEAKLAGVSLAFADFRRGQAERADFVDGVLDHLDAQDATLPEAILRNADLSFARFTRADLSKSDMTGVKTVGAAFLGASLPRGVLLVETAGRPKETRFDLRL
ncbi:MAG TPA: pentapeptide repeat-containing protein, partial [Thermoanaerobaculia bacterium]|nr:pentapeptide repeat-containing protein [Thermoanaerobaculia bacterium]